MASTSTSTSTTATTETFEQIPVHESTGVPTLATRWEQVRVTRIENVRIANMARFTESKTINLGGPLSGRVTRDQVGMLCHADAEIVVTLSEPTRLADLSVFFDNWVTVASRETQVSIGRTVDDTVSSPEHDAPVSSVCITVPLTRGLYDRVPLLDEVHTQGKHFVHHTISITGVENGRPTEWKVRIRVDPAEAVVDVVSVNNSLVDAVRLSESWNNFRQLVSESAAKLATAARGCFAKRKTTSGGIEYSAVPTSDASEAHQQHQHQQHFTSVLPAPIPVHASLYPPMQGGVVYMPVAPGKLPEQASGAAPQMFYYAMPPSSVWPQQQQSSGSDAAAPLSPPLTKRASPDIAANVAPKFELVGTDE